MTHFSPFEMFLMLVFAHALADYPLQGDFLSKAKNHKSPIPTVPWWQAMLAHCTIQAGFVGIITGSVRIALLEFVIHFATDYSKCDGKISYNTDQAIHVLCKLAWVLLLTYYAKTFAAPL